MLKYYRLCRPASLSSEELRSFNGVLTAVFVGLSEINVKYTVQRNNLLFNLSN